MTTAANEVSGRESLASSTTERSDALAGARTRLDHLRNEIDANETLTRTADLAQA
ncbi:hypothetical protein [Streptomyces kronopolitis]|uniref:hypothetical protein n=1 Tax=Streptomyces kronopolitis TaxID=1612435 RepID=UPI00367F346F